MPSASICPMPQSLPPGRKAKDAVEYSVADLLGLPLPGETFDVVICFDAIEHVAERGAVLDELKRVVRSEGFLLLSSPNRDVYLHHVYEYTPEEPRADLASGSRTSPSTGSMRGWPR
jgi:ubiquinone/menaquinone biosynthesis C-methylase UbiE